MDSQKAYGSCTIAEILPRFLFIHRLLPVTFGHFGSMTLKLSLIVDGIEEAVSELFAGLGLIYQKMEKERSMNETCLRKCFYKNSQ